VTKERRSLAQRRRQRRAALQAITARSGFTRSISLLMTSTIRETSILSQAP
jgi:hypothetical protein